ncbi:MAG: efflux RND transporter periplasmic adaptor subunit [Alphaproteobacteria bacterium]|nr:efflux RND transporter periplasmic adaptor subunit [Alphaproteobacteria bacterium]
MKRFIIWFTLLACAGAAAFIFLHRTRGVEVVTPLRDTAIKAVYATGTVEPTVMIPIAPRVAGRIMSLNADEGQRVKKGELLAQLEDTDLQKSLEEQQALLDQAEKDYARKASLLKTNAVAHEIVEQAAAARDADKAAVAQIQAQIDYMKLTAPADGTIIRRDGEVGQLIPVNQPVFYMECCAPMRIAAEVDEEDIALVQPGQKVVISADAFPGKVFDGTVQSITPKGDPVARSYRVRIGLDGDTPLMVGMTAETNIVIETKKNALLIPATSVVGGHVWLLQKNGTLKSAPVKTGISTVKAVEVLEGLDDKSAVARDAGTEGLKDGMRVRPSFGEWQDK